jgi:hypothetical protein
LIGVVKGSLCVQNAVMRFLASWLADISFVRGLPVPLEKINLSGTRVLDLSPLADTDVEVVAASFTPVADLSALRGKSLTGACFCSTKVSDISMLEGMPVTHAQFHDTGVSDISALSGAPLIQLEVSATGGHGFASTGWYGDLGSRSPAYRPDRARP